MHFLTKTEALQFVSERMDLFEHAERVNPFAGGEWTLHFLEHIVENSWTIIIPEYLVSGESLMLMYSDTKAPYRRSALTNYYASLYSPLVSFETSTDQRRFVLERLVEQLTKVRPRCAVVDFMPLDEDSADTAHLQQALVAAGYYTKRYLCFGNWYLPCAHISFHDFMNSRESRLLNTWSRKRRKFELSPSNDARLEVIMDPASVDRGMEAYEHVYERSWKKPEPYSDFVRGWARICARKGWLRLGVAWLGEKPIAAQFWFTMHGRAYIFKLAYDEEYAKLSPGTVLSAHMFRQALDEDHAQEIDYLTGDDAYKKLWMSHRRQRVGIVGCNPWVPRGLFQSLRELTGDITRPWRARFAARGNTPNAEPGFSHSSSPRPPRDD